MWEEGKCWEEGNVGGGGQSWGEECGEGAGGTGGGCRWVQHPWVKKPEGLEAMLSGIKVGRSSLFLRRFRKVGTEFWPL